MKFYKFDSEGHFKSQVVPQGVCISVVGLIPDGGLEEDWQEVPAPDGGFTLTRMKDEAGRPAFRPTYKYGWHVNADRAVEGWEEMEINPTNPIRVFA